MRLGQQRWASARPGRELRRAVVVPPAWKAYVGLVLSLVGLGVSIYLTLDHFARIPLACSDSGLVNCTKVTTSAESYFLGAPVAVLGLGFFVVMTLLNLPRMWFSGDRRVHVVRLVLSGVGMCFVLYLVAAELLIINSICLWCTSVHVATFMLFVLNVRTVPRMLRWESHSASCERGTTFRGLPRSCCRHVDEEEHSLASLGPADR